MKITSVKSFLPCPSVIQTIYILVHGGNPKVETIEMEGTTFSIILPLV